jgi:ABC-type glycerol-3-phosphate transport system permease component
MTIPSRHLDFLTFCRQRRWALLFLNLAAGLFCAPFLYWNSILMRVVTGAAHGVPILLGLNTLHAIGSFVLALLAAFGIGGCLSALRGILAGREQFLPAMVFTGMRRCARTSLLAGGLVGLSLGVMRVGLVDLHALLPSGMVRALLSAFLLLQFLAVLPLGLLAVTQEDELQHRPLRTFIHVCGIFAAHPLRYFGLLALSLLPVQFFFVWQRPLMTLLGFVFVELAALTPMMLLWQRAARNPAVTRSKGAAPLGMLLLFFLLDVLALFLPLLRQGVEPTRAVQATMRQTFAFLTRQTLLDADNGTFRDLLSSSTVWPLLVAALLGSACCIMVIYACACYTFPARKLVCATAVLLQILPMLYSYAALEQLLRNLNLRISSLVLGVAWALLYLMFALLLYQRFRSLRPKFAQHQAEYPGVRLFFYYALPRAQLHVITLTALITLGCWNDALAPFWIMRSLGAFSAADYIWNSLSGWAERMTYAVLFVLVLLLFLGAVRLAGRRLQRR